MTLRCLILLFVIVTSPAKILADMPVMDWMSRSFSELTSLLSGCLEVPNLNSFNTGSQSLDLTKSDTWVATGAYVSNGKMINFDWGTTGITSRPRKYIVMYRIDPRFSVPQIFIQTYDYGQGKYVSDFDNVLAGQLNRYQLKPEIIFSQRVADFNNYFTFNNRSPIPVYANEVINISLTQTNNFFTGAPGFSAELGDDSDTLSIINTQSPIADNKIIYANMKPWCLAMNASAGISNMICDGNSYKNLTDPIGSLIGVPFEPKLTYLQNSLASCASSLNTRDVPELCYYDHGRGFNLSISNQIIKNEATAFLHSDFLNKDFFYFKAKSDGNLNISTSWQINKMFNNYEQVMINWPNISGVTDLDSLNNYVNNSANIAMNFMHFGRYLMIIEIGSGDQTVSTNQQKAIKVEYVISDSKPADGSSGTEIPPNVKLNAPQDGYLWLRVINPNTNVAGSINVNYTNYVGTTWFSDIIYGDIISPLRDQFNDLTILIYTKFTNNPTMQRLAKLMLTLYIVFYGLYFLAGATKITVSDIINRVIKVSIIVALFSPQSWNFFNNNLFQVFTEGTNQLMTNVVGATSSTTNIFGFIDPIFDKYLDPRVWSLLFLQLFQIQNGLAFFAIITIYSLLVYFRAVLEVIIGYVIAFISLAVLISLAPFFITFLLFEQTKSLFNNWLSSLFSNMIQPTVLLIFFLLIDQIITVQFTKVVVKACWGCWIPLKIGLDLNNMGIPLNLSFSLPFLNCIPFFITEVQGISTADDIFDLPGTFINIAGASLLFYCYSLLAKGLVDFVTTVVSVLTNVMPARQEGDIQKPGNPTAAIMSDFDGYGKTIKGAAFTPLKFAKSKLIDQKYGSSGGGGKRANFSNSFSSSDDEPENGGGSIKINGSNLPKNDKGSK